MSKQIKMISQYIMLCFCSWVSYMIFLYSWGFCLLKGNHVYGFVFRWQFSKVPLSYYIPFWHFDISYFVITSPTLGFRRLLWRQWHFTVPTNRNMNFHISSVPKLMRNCFQWKWVLMNNNQPLFSYIILHMCYALPLLCDGWKK